MIKNYATLLCSLLVCVCFSQTTFNGNGNTGFGGVIGPSTMVVNDNGTTLTFTITRGPGEFFDALVIYLDTTTGGRISIDVDVNDQADPLRRAISSAGFDDSVLSFPPGFEPDFAFGIDTSFGGLWSIPATGIVGDGDLPFLTALNSTLVAASDTSFTFDVDWSELGLTNTDSFDFIGIYLNPNNGFTSDEAYGSDVIGGNIGGNDYTFTSFFTYSNTLSSSELNAEREIKLVNNQLIVSNYQGDLNVKVIDINGRLINQITTFSTSNDFSIPIQLPKNQILIVSVTGENFNKTLKVVSH